MALVKSLRGWWHRLHAATSLGFKLFAPMGALVVLAIGLLGALGYRAQREALTAQYVERARAVAALFDHEFDELDYSLTDRGQVDRHVSHLLALYPEIVRITIYAWSKDAYRALYSSDPAAVGQAPAPDDVEPLRTGRTSVHEVVVDDRRLLEVNLPLRRDGRAVAAVGVYASLEERDRRLQAYIRWAASTAAATLATLVGLLYLATRLAVVVPLRRALARAEQLAAGDVPADLPASREEFPGPVRDEVERFDRALDAAVRQVIRDREQIHALAITDPLTGLHNRHFFEEVIPREVARAQRYQEPFALAVVDVNGLREVNNRHGHLAGDDLLRRAARFLQSHVRATDEVIRWGGDEFLVLMPRTDEVQAAAVAQRLVEALGSDGQDAAAPPLAFSVGVAA